MVDIGNVNGYSMFVFYWLKKNVGKYGFINNVGGEYWYWKYIC